MARGVVQKRGAKLLNEALRRGKKNKPKTKKEPQDVKKRLVRSK